MALTPPVVDDMELWEVAVCLGKALPSNDYVPSSTSDQPQRAPDTDDVVQRRYENIRRRRAGLPELEEPDERPAHVDPSLATLITTNAPERLR